MPCRAHQAPFTVRCCDLSGNYRLNLKPYLENAGFDSREGQALVESSADQSSRAATPHPEPDVPAASASPEPGLTDGDQMIFLLLALLSTPAHAELCWSHLDRSVADERHIYWRMIDGQKCWFRGGRQLPKEDLVPAFDAKEFDEGGVVTGRKFYTPEELPEKVNKLPAGTF